MHPGLTPAACKMGTSGRIGPLRIEELAMQQLPMQIVG
jgi:hypothetical protein